MSEISGEPYNPRGHHLTSDGYYCVSTNAGVVFHIERKYEYIKCIGTILKIS